MAFRNRPIGLECLEDRVVLAAPGSLDLSFGSLFSFEENTYARAKSIATQTDGKFVVAGTSGEDFALVRFNANGSLDTNFGTGGRVTTHFDEGNAIAESVAIQADGKIIVAGYSYYQSSNPDFTVTRYNSNGSLDTTFGTGGKVKTNVGGNDFAYSVAIQPNDGKIVVAGVSYFPNEKFAVVRYNTDGSLDATFDGDGKVGTDCGGNTYGSSVAIDSNGRIVVTGSVDLGDFDVAIVRYNTDGSLDTTFDGDGKVTSHVGGVHNGSSVAIQSDNKIVIACAVDNEVAIVRFNTNGSLDATFDGDGIGLADLGGLVDLSSRSVALQSDNKIVVAGNFFNAEGTSAFLLRIGANGSLDTSFDGDGKVTTDLGGGNENVAILPSGKIVIAGSAAGWIALRGFNTDGSLDPNFQGGGKVRTHVSWTTEDAEAVAIQPDGKIIAVGMTAASGYNANFALVRYNPSGSLDSTFGTGGIVTTDFGSLEWAHAVALQSDGKIIAAGFMYVAGNQDFGLVRYNSNGSLDATFGTGGKVTTPIGAAQDETRAVAIQSDGKIVVAGYSNNGSNYDFALARYNSSGTLDTSFGTGGKVTTAIGSSHDKAFAMALQSDGKIVLGGWAYMSLSAL